MIDLKRLRSNQSIYARPSVSIARRTQASMKRRPSITMISRPEITMASTSRARLTRPTASILPSAPATSHTLPPGAPGGRADMLAAVPTGGGLGLSLGGITGDLGGIGGDLIAKGRSFLPLAVKLVLAFVGIKILLMLVRRRR